MLHYHERERESVCVCVCFVLLCYIKPNRASHVVNVSVSNKRKDQTHVHTDCKKEQGLTITSARLICMLPTDSLQLLAVIATGAGHSHRIMQESFKNINRLKLTGSASCTPTHPQPGTRRCPRLAQ